MGNDTTAGDGRGEVIPARLQINRAPGRVVQEDIAPPSTSSRSERPPSYEVNDTPPAQSVPPNALPLNLDWSSPPPYTTEEPPGYDEPSYPYTAPVIIQPGAEPNNNVDSSWIIDNCPTTTTTRSVPVRPQKYMGLAIFTCVFCCCIFGAIALVYAVLAYKAKDNSWARKMAKISLVVSSFGLVAGTVATTIVLLLVGGAANW